ncbi:MAG TPA: PH domain-containing protein [Candidatus Dormibacteraeota bacterium]|nr:PH domain-containing protein [Candidatus Dormibacteraeota bacterium]
MTALQQQAAATSDGAAWRRLDRRLLLVYPIREVGRLLPLLVGIVVAGSGTGRSGLWGLAGGAVAISLGLLRWFTTSYRIAASQIQVRKGLLRRQVISVSLDRVRTVDVSVSAMHRVLGLARVTVGTGLSDRGRDDALRLDGLSTADATRLRDELLHRHDSAQAQAAVSQELLAAAAPSWVRYAPFTLSGFVTVFVVLGFAWRVVSEAHVDPTRLTTESGQLVVDAPWLAAVVGGFLLLVAVAAASAVGYVLAFWGFRLVRTADGVLQVTRGLISTRSTAIEERRLRGIELSEPLLLRAVRGARCIAIATGLRVGRGAERGGTLLLPPAPREEAVRVIAAVLRARDPVIAPLARHGAAAHRRRYTRVAIALALLTGVVVVLSRLMPVLAWSWEVLLVVVPCGAALAYDRYLSLGHALVGRFLVARRGSLVRRRYMLDCDGIIGWNLTQSFFQRRLGLATLVATTAAGRQWYDVQDLTLDEAVRVADQAVPGLLTPFLVDGEARAASA